MKLARVVSASDVPGLAQVIPRILLVRQVSWAPRVVSQCCHLLQRLDVFRRWAPSVPLNSWRLVLVVLRERKHLSLKTSNGSKIKRRQRS